MFLVKFSEVLKEARAFDWNKNFSSFDGVFSVKVKSLENIASGMRRRSELYLVILLALLFSAAASLALKTSQASENQDVEFEVIGFGDISGYGEETYIVIETEAEWANVWEKHTILYQSSPHYPEINFSGHMVICAFMGRRSTTGYSISIERMWASADEIHVEITKNSPPEDFVVAHMLTYPFVFASLEKTDLGFVFNVTEEDGTVIEYVLPEFSTTVFTLMVFVTFSAIILVLTRKIQNIN